ncbi:response regulator [Tindallia californiensis]|uniref:Stage 0 sporulation protein A homolog n=1 Tax=Tindallia californiensis TaxID=159292 RepID=A0A1H3J1Z7_9FIRM|nr:response regulator [Tindallia californiensis]SDY34030.1 two-component system, response regulator YcbB [Tindallia californiensis]
METRFYIADDDLSIQRILESIIEKHHLGFVIGTATDGKSTVNEVISLQPDIVLVDLLMPHIDGIGVVSMLNESKCNSSFIMISQVDSSDMIATAYEKGIEFFISKPINVVEVVSVIKNIKEKQSLTKMLYSFESAVKMIRGNEPVLSKSEGQDYLKANIRKVLANLGISGEAGYQDLIEILALLMKNDPQHNHYHSPKMSEAYEQLKNHYLHSGSHINTGTIEQRIRRTIKSALNNLSHRGLEDYHDDLFIRYSSLLFEFSEVRREMDFLKGKKATGGKISVRKFVDGIQILLADESAL